MFHNFNKHMFAFRNPHTKAQKLFPLGKKKHYLKKVRIRILERFRYTYLKLGTLFGKSMMYGNFNVRFLITKPNLLYNIIII